MNEQLKIIDTKKQQFDAAHPLPPAAVKNLRDWFAIELTYNSNAIEGNMLTKSETALVVEKGLTIGGKSMREHLEAINHAQALKLIEELAQKKRTDISLADIVTIHALILKEIDNANAGKLRAIDVRISGSDVVLPLYLRVQEIVLPSHMKVQKLMDDFIAWLHSVDGHPVTVAADAHLKFVTIHPFVDGNGRTARLLMNLLLMQAGYPPAIIRNDKRLEYINSLEKAQLTDDVSDYHAVVYSAVERSLNEYLKAV